MKLPRRWAWPAVGFASATLGYALYGAPVDPGQPFGWCQELGAGLIFVAWVSGILGWGRIGSRFLNPQNPMFVAFALGSVWAWVSAAVLGHLGLAGAQNANWWRGILTAGILAHLCVPVRGKQTEGGWPGWRTEGLAVLFVGLVVVGASRLNFYQDPLWYHLVAPRLWFEEGRIYLPATNLTAYKGGGWEYLNMWGNILLAGPKGGGLVAGHLFGQWIHSFVGFGGTALALYHLARRFTDQAWVPLAVLAGISSNTMAFIAVMAKNDWGVTFWTLSGLVCLLNADGAEVSKGWRLVAGLLFGSAFSGKFTVGFTLLPLLAGWVWVDTRKWGWRPASKAAWPLAAGFALAALPILVRNYGGTGNPFFPSLGGIFGHGGLGPTWIRTLAEDFEGGRENFERPFLLFLRLGSYLTDSFTVLGLLLFPWALSAVSRERYRFWISCLIIAFLLFYFGTGIYLENRLLGPLNVLGAFFGLLLIAEVIRASPRFREHERTVQAVLFALFAFAGQIPWSAPLTLADAGPPTKQLSQLEGWEAIRWVRENLRASRLLFAEESRTYYLSDLGVSRMFDYPELDRAIASQKDLKLTLDLFQKFGFTHLIEVRSTVYDAYFDRALCQTLVKAAMSHPSAVLFKGQDRPEGPSTSMVISVPALAAAIRQQSSSLRR